MTAAARLAAVAVRFGTSYVGLVIGSLIVIVVSMNALATAQTEWQLFRTLLFEEISFAPQALADYKPQTDTRTVVINFDKGIAGSLRDAVTSLVGAIPVVSSRIIDEARREDAARAAVAVGGGFGLGADAARAVAAQAVTQASLTVLAAGGSQGPAGPTPVGSGSIAIPFAPGPTRSPTATPTTPASPVPSATGSVTSSPTASRTSSPTASRPPTETSSPTPPSTVTPSRTPTESPTPSATATSSPTTTPSETPTATPTSSATATPTVTPSPTQSPTASPSSTATQTPTSTATATATSSRTPSPTATTTATSTVTTTPTETPTSTPTPSPTPSPTATTTPTSTVTSTPTETATATPTPTAAPTATATIVVPTPSASCTQSPSLTPLVLDLSVPGGSSGSTQPIFADASACQFGPTDDFTKSVYIQNNGTRAIDYYVGTSGGSGPLWTDATNGFQLSVTRNGVVVYDGALAMPDQLIGQLARGGQDGLQFTVYLPTTAGNAYQGLSTTISFNFTTVVVP